MERSSILRAGLILPFFISLASIAAEPVSTPSAAVEMLSSAGFYRGGFYKHVWTVQDATLAKQALWEPLSAAAVPLDPQKACSIALDRLRATFPEVSDWLVASIALRNVLERGTRPVSHPNVWFYVITFTPKDRKARERFEHEGSDRPFDQLVLLDGTVVSPATTRDEKK